ncbi:MAG: nuclear transport factor 2 family protein [Omnitrophica WOR_2 bacterium]
MDRNSIDDLMNAFAAKNLEQVLSFFKEDALVYDPHYPIPEMRGKAAIRRGLEWGLGNMEKPGFQIRNCWLDGDKAVVEVDTDHIFKGGMRLKFPQVFVIEARDGLITRLQSYVPYPPHGIPRLLAQITRLQWKLQGKSG